MFCQDPSEFIIPMEQEWPRYIKEGENLELAAKKSVVEWRLADDAVFVPKHPFYRTINTRESNGFWTAQPMRWVDRVEKEFNAVHHGIDAQGRIVHARRMHYSDFIVFGDGFYDVLNGYPDLDTGGRMVAEKEHRGYRCGRFTRLFTDAAGRITTKVELNNEGPDPDRHNRSTEVFVWQNNRLVESFRQSFDRGDEIPDWMSDLSPEKQASMYRRVNDQLREFLPRRSRIQYAYDSEGCLTVASKHDGETGKLESTLYTHDPSDTIETVSDELVNLLSQTLVKMLKAEKSVRPIRRVALLYSAEHAHCGLPTKLLLSSADDNGLNPLDWEAYPHEGNWPPAGRISRKIDSLLRRLLIVVDGSATYGQQDAPIPYRDVLWRVSRVVYDELADRKRLVTEDFAVFPLDDHGDVDSAEDVRRSLPPAVADQVIAELKR